MTDLPRRRSALRFVAATMLVLLPLVGGGMWFYRGQEHKLRADVERDLAIAAHLKADQIAAWRRHRLEEGAQLMARRWLIGRLPAWLAGTAGPGEQVLEDELRSLIQHEDYADVILVDPEGRIRFSLTDRPQLYAAEMEALGVAWRERHPVFVDFPADHAVADAHLAVVVPLLLGSGENRQPVSAAILVIDPSRFLYPLIRRWPTSSQTAETLLVGRNGDSLRFLNPLRHPTDRPATLPLSEAPSDLPAAMALRGEEGFVEGVDYRGVPVAAFIVPVPDSPWWMVAKLDAAEAFATWRVRSVMIVLLVLGGVALLSTAAFLVWERSQKGFYRELHALEMARQTEAQRFRIILNSIGDAVITTDADGRVESLNPVAETLTGWRDEEARGRPLDEVFWILNEETRQTVENPATRVLREGVTIGLANHTLLVARDGTQRPIADSGAPIRDEQGAIGGVVLVFRDQTEERAAQRARQFTDALVNRSQEPIYAVDANRDFQVVFANDAVCRHLGYTREQLLTMSPADWDPQYPLPRLRESWASQKESGAIVIETTNRTADGRVVPVEVFISHLEFEGAKLSIGSIRDVTERKKAEERIRFQAHLLNVVEHAVIATDAEGVISYWNRAAERLYGWRAAEAVGRSIIDMTVAQTSEEQAAEILDSLAKGRSWSGEFDVRRADGTTFPAHVTDTPLCDESGRIVGVVGISYDVSDRRRAHEELQQHAENLERFNRLAVGRELRMIELKQQVAGLQAQLGQPPPLEPDMVPGPTIDHP